MAKRNSNNSVIQETKNKKSKTAKQPDNGKDTSAKSIQGFSKDKLINILKTMQRSRSIDNKAMRLLKQGKSFFHIAAAGHEAIQIAIGLQLDSKNDWLFPYYRDLGTVLMAGMTPEQVFLGTFAKATDPSSGGRQLPVHWGLSDRNLPSQSSPTGTQFLQAVGTALASKKKKCSSDFAFFDDFLTIFLTSCTFFLSATMTASAVSTMIIFSMPTAATRRLSARM